MKLITIFLSLIFAVTLPSYTLAHGGFEKRTGSVIVYVKQDPISPLVGEKVRLSFSFRDEGIKQGMSLNDQNLTNWPVKVNVVDTYYGNQSLDKSIYSEEFTTDANASFEFEYTFAKENYFDIDLDFKDARGNNLETGFLIQPRTPKDIIINSSFDVKYILLSYSAGVITLLSLVKFSKIKKLALSLFHSFPK